MNASTPIDAPAPVCDDAEHRLAARRRSCRSPSDTPLVWVALAVGFGGVAAWPLGTAGVRPEPLIALAVVGLVAWAAAWRRGRDALAAGTLLTAVALAGCGWSAAAWRLFGADDIGRYADNLATPIAVEVVATATPTVYPADEPSPYRAIPATERSVLPARVLRLRDGVAWRAASGDCEVAIDGELAGVMAGDRLRVFGQLRRPTPARNPGERDAASAARQERRLATVWTKDAACLTRLDTTGPNAGGGRLAGARSWATQRLAERLSDKATPLARAMLLGEGSMLSQATVEAFRRTGTLHVLVVSGLHVGLVALVLPGLAALGLLPRRLAWGGAMLLVVGYVVLAGGRPPAVRAGIVAGAACLAALAGRRPISVNSLAGAALAVFVASPGAWLAVGTQLSFVATATLLGAASVVAKRHAAVVPPLERLIRSAQTPWRRIASGWGDWLRWALGGSLAVLVVIGPLVASEFHLVSPLSAPLAVLLTPLVALTVGGGLVALACEAMATLLGAFGGLAAVAAACCDAATLATKGIVESLNETSVASFYTSGPAGWWSAGWIGLLATGALGETYGRDLRGLTGRLLLLLVAAGFAPPLARLVLSGDALRCSFIAVGHGSATLLEAPDGQAVLVDAGALGAPDRVADTVARALWSRGVTRLEAVVLSHPDVDHYNALPGLLDRFAIEQVWVSARMFPRRDDPDDRSGPAELLRLLREEGVPIRQIRFGDRFSLAETRIEVLHPDDLGVIGSDNANSVVLGVEHQGRRLLLPGDLESPGIDFVMAQEPYDCDVLLAPHHGSERSDPPGFAAWCRPEHVVISSGKPPTGARLSYEAAGATVLSTHRAGMVTFELSRAGTDIRRHGIAGRPSTPRAK